MRRVCPDSSLEVFARGVSSGFSVVFVQTSSSSGSSASRTICNMLLGSFAEYQK
jgi:hypothetical protein